MKNMCGDPHQTPLFAYRSSILFLLKTRIESFTLKSRKSGASKESTNARQCATLRGATRVRNSFQITHNLVGNLPDWIHGDYL